MKSVTNSVCDLILFYGVSIIQNLSSKPIQIISQNHTTITNTGLSLAKPLHIYIHNGKNKLFVTRSSVLAGAQQSEPENILDELNRELHFISMECTKGYSMLEKSQVMLEDAHNILDGLKNAQAAINPILVPTFNIPLYYTRPSLENLLMVLDQNLSPTPQLTADYIRQILNLFKTLEELGGGVSPEYIKVEVDYHSKLPKIKSLGKAMEFDKDMDLAVNNLRDASRTTKQALRVLTNAATDLGVVAQRAAMWAVEVEASG